MQGTKWKNKLYFKDRFQLQILSLLCSKSLCSNRIQGKVRYFFIQVVDLNLSYPIMAWVESAPRFNQASLLAMNCFRAFKAATYQCTLNTISSDNINACHLRLSGVKNSSWLACYTAQLLEKYQKWVCRSREIWTRNFSN